MISTRLALALEAGLVLPSQPLVFHPQKSADLSALEKPLVVQPNWLDHAHFVRQGFDVVPEVNAPAPGSIVCLPKAKREALALIARAARLSDGCVIVDGQKDEGVDSILKAVRQRVAVSGVVSKAHGKLFWFSGGPEFADWEVGPERTEGGFWTAPGVFSADGIDEGSALLAEALPDDLTGDVADLGAGWGFLSAHILTRASVKTLHLVEAHHMALQCAEHNVTDPRARFHWADATIWEAPSLMDAVVMNPPFHMGKKGDPRIGQAFISAAAAMLRPRGALWMVANRHLPYEEALASGFMNIVDLGGNSRFKLFCANRPKRRR